MKGILQSVFESDYSFDLEQLKKQNIGAAVKRLQKLPGATPFGVAYATQTALGGHSIPARQGNAGRAVRAGRDQRGGGQNRAVPGMERAIPKSKGQEFGGLLHELGADFFANPFSQSLRELAVVDRAGRQGAIPQAGDQEAGPEPPPAPPVAKAAAGSDKKKAKDVAPAKKTAAKAVEKHAEKHADKRTARDRKPAAHAKGKPAAKIKKTPAKVLTKRKPR